ncbi:adenosylcobinamide-GDP ribazoletransferase [Sphingomonas sp. MMS24-JH45]
MTGPPVWAAPLMAVQLLTRLPVPLLARLDADQAQAAARRMLGWLPLAGTLVGIVTAAVFVAAARVWQPTIAAGVALAVEAALTGAFHEDAADFADAFGGQAIGEDARRIMKDSLIGSYGALWLVLLVGLRWTAMAALPITIAAGAIVGAASLGRLWAVVLMRAAPPLPGHGGLAASVGTPTGRSRSRSPSSFRYRASRCSAPRRWALRRWRASWCWPCWRGRSRRRIGGATAIASASRPMPGR